MPREHFRGKLELQRPCGPGPEHLLQLVERLLLGLVGHEEQHLVSHGWPPPLFGRPTNAIRAVKLPKPVRKRYSNPPTRSGNSELETDVQPAPRPTAPDASGQRHHAVIVFADVVGYSRLMADDEPRPLDPLTALSKNWV